MFRFLSAIAVGFFIQSAAIAGERPPEFPESIIQKAHQKGLAKKKQWLRLLHYQSGWWGSPKSAALGSFFFLAPDGATDPEHEMDATIRGFFRLPTAAENDATLEVSHPGQPDPQAPQCQFPARLIWLEKELGFSDQDLPAQNCLRYEHFAKTANAKSVTLVFSSYYLNNPSSAFGHTFLRLNQEKASELFDYGINYAALVDTNNSFVYGVKGLLGLFPGTFTSLPYYYKIREYNDFESRDMWEYNLDLNPEQTALLVAHLWELGSTYFRYFYFTKNCSYEILNLINVVRPDAEVINDNWLDVIPADTVRALDRVPGLVSSVHYRPSIRTQFDRRVEILTDPQRTALSDLLEARFTAGFANAVRGFMASPQSQEYKLAVLDAAADYIEMTYNSDLISEEKRKASPAVGWKRMLLTARSEIPIPTLEIEVPTPWHKNPEAGHGTKRLTFDSGGSQQYGAFSSLEIRMALQDLADPSAGYPDYSQIEMFGARFRYEYDPPKSLPRLWLDDITAFRVISLNPQTQFNKKLSWTVSLQGKRFYDGICAGTCFGPSFEVGGGVAENIFTPDLTVFLFGMLEAIASPGFSGAHFRPGLGPTGGFRFHPADRFGMSLMGSYRYRFLAGPHDGSAISWVNRLEFAKDVAVEGKVDDFYPHFFQGSAGVAFYF